MILRQIALLDRWSFLGDNMLGKAKWRTTPASVCQKNKTHSLWLLVRGIKHVVCSTYKVRGRGTKLKNNERVNNTWNKQNLTKIHSFTIRESHFSPPAHAHTIATSNTKWRLVKKWFMFNTFHILSAAIMSKLQMDSSCWIISTFYEKNLKCKLLVHHQLIVHWWSKKNYFNELSIINSFL